MAANRIRPKKLSEPTVSRLPIYLRIAEQAARSGEDRLDSKRIAELAGHSATTVRRDLSGIGTLGKRGSGYDPTRLAGAISKELGLDQQYNAIVVGMGNLGRALVNSQNFITGGGTLVGIYDVDPAVIGTTVGGFVVQDFNGPLAEASTAILCVPPAASQSVADRLMAHGVTALLNFAPQVLTRTPEVSVHYVDFSIELQVLRYRQNHRLSFSGVVHSVGATSPNTPGSPAVSE